MLNKKEVKEERFSKIYRIDGKDFMMEVVFRDGKFTSFKFPVDSGHKVKHGLSLDEAKDVEVFESLKDFFKNLE